MSPEEKAKIIEEIGTPLLTTAEAAGLLAVSRRTVINWVSENRVPHLRLPGGEYRIPFFSLASTIESSMNETEVMEELKNNLARIRSRNPKS